MITHLAKLRFPAIDSWWSVPYLFGRNKNPIETFLYKSGREGMTYERRGEERSGFAAGIHWDGVGGPRGSWDADRSGGCRGAGTTASLPNKRRSQFERSGTGKSGD